NTSSCRCAYFSGDNAKSLAFQPEANDMSTRPPDRLSTIDHSSAIRNGSCKGSTTLPARNRIRRVSRASAACSTDGLGYKQPHRVKCRSGTQTLKKPCRSAYRALSTTSRYLSPLSASSLLAKNIKPKSSPSRDFAGATGLLDWVSSLRIRPSAANDHGT